MDKSIISEALGRLRKEMRGRTGKKMVGPTVTIEIAHKPDANAASPDEEAAEGETDDKAKGAPGISDIVAKAMRGGKR